MPDLSAKASNLSGEKYGYDYVLSTTQASINSDLLEYLSRAKEHISYLCFLADADGNVNGQAIPLEDLLKLSKGANPFDIPNNTKYDDPRIKALTEARFICGLKIQIGLPPGVLPKDLPAPVVVLGQHANTVIFNMYCSEFTVIQNAPPGGFVSTGVWSVFSQPPGHPWYVQTKVDLVVKDLNTNLDTPYFRANPEKQKAISDQLLNMSGSAFSLQQLVYDFDNAFLESSPKIEGIAAGSNAEAVLQKSFISGYSDNAKKNGQPLVSVHAVAQPTDNSQLILRAFERQVNPLRDDLGFIARPTAAQESVTTLSYLCAVTKNPLPGASEFTWNWVDANDVNAKSGVLAIKRSVIAEFIKNQLLPSARKACIHPTTHVTAHAMGAFEWSVDLPNMQEPTSATITSSGEKVLEIDYRGEGRTNDQSGATYVEFNMVSTYHCDVTFKDNTITVKQKLTLNIYLQWDKTSDSFNGFDKTITDVYTMSVDQNGAVHLNAAPSTVEDHPQGPSRSAFVNFWTGINDDTGDIKNKTADFVKSSLASLGISDFQNFIFPGGNVFTYKSVEFSNSQDLLCDITYVKSKLDTSTQARHVATSQRVASAAPSLLPSKLTQTPSGTTISQGLLQNTADPVDRGSKDLQLTYSSEMMQNYVKGEIVSPSQKFEALQSADGHALLFAVDTSGSLHVIEEQSGTTHTGWSLTDLSSSVIAQRFPGGSVRTFDVGQDGIDQTIWLAMAVSSNGSDHLLVSLSNSSQDTSWIAHPNWVVFPFDDVANSTNKSPKIIIEGILFAETSTNDQYLIVDIDRSTDSKVKHITRYYISTTMSSSSHWVKHDVADDIEVIQDGNYQSCVGRSSGGRVDGVYTSGSASGTGQLIYMPVINEFGDGPPVVTRLRLPNNAVASAIATTRNEDGTTNLYAVSGSTLYFFAAEDQRDDNDLGQALVTNACLAGTNSLAAMTQADVTTLWGKNSSNEVYYLSCHANQVSIPGMWSLPVPVKSEVERISPYVNKKDGGNTIFAAGGGKLTKLFQATGTSSKVWQEQAISLEAPPQQKSLAFNSYTTTIQVTDANGSPAKGSFLHLSTQSRTPVYINGLYYVLNPSPERIKTDSTGTLTIIEATTNIVGSVISVSPDGVHQTKINPMERAFKKLTALSDAGKLKDASIPTATKAGGIIGPSQQSPLVSTSTSDKDAQTVADNLVKLHTIHANIDHPSMQLSRARTRRVVPTTQLLASTNSLGSAIAIAAGDLFRWLTTGVDALLQIVKDTASEVWHFMATIGDKIYHAILDSAEAIVGAVEWVFNAIKTAIEDLVRFVQFLFEWDDIRRTKDVMHNILVLSLKKMVSGVNSLKTDIDTGIVAAEKRISEWAGISDFSSLGDEVNKPAASAKGNPAEGQTSGSKMLSTHFQNHSHEISVKGGDSALDVAESLLDELGTAMMQEGEVLSGVFNQLQTITAKFDTMSGADIIKAIVGVLANGVLSSVKVVVDALLNIISSLSGNVITLLDRKLHIPIISDILNDIGIPDISFLDLFTWISAVSYTVVYKIAKNEAPFPDNDHTKTLIAAQDWSSLYPHTSLPNAPQKRAVHADGMLLATKPRPRSMDPVFVASHAIACCIGMLGEFIHPFEALEINSDNAFTTVATVAKVLLIGCTGVQDWLQPVGSIQDKVMSNVRVALSVVELLNKVAYSSFAQKRFTRWQGAVAALIEEDWRAVGAFNDALIVIPQLLCSTWRFGELSHRPESSDRTIAIINEVSKAVNYVSRISYAVAVNTRNPEAKTAPILVMAISNGVVAVLQVVQVVID